MKTVTLTSLFLAAFTLHAQTTPKVPRLSGIVNLPDVKEAVFEFASDPRIVPHYLISGEEKGWGVNVLKISPELRTVEITLEPTNSLLVLSLLAASNSVQNPVAGVDLSEASLLSVLELYGQFSRKTVLAWPQLPATTFTLHAHATNRIGIVRALKEAFNQQGMATVDDGDKFILLLPTNQLTRIKPRAPIPTNNETQGFEMCMHGMPISQVFDAYAHFRDEKFDLRAPIPSPVQELFFFTTRSPLTKREVLYALETLFEWQDIVIVKDQNGLLRAVQKTKE